MIEIREQRDKNCTQNILKHLRHEEIANLFDANNSRSNGIVVFSRHYISRNFFITSINFPIENETMECDPSVIRLSKREQIFGATERERQGYGCSTRDSNNTESRCDGNQKRHWQAELTPISKNCTKDVAEVVETRTFLRLRIESRHTDSADLS